MADVGEWLADAFIGSGVGSAGHAAGAQLAAGMTHTLDRTSQNLADALPGAAKAGGQALLGPAQTLARAAPRMLTPPLAATAAELGTTLGPALGKVVSTIAVDAASRSGDAIEAAAYQAGLRAPTLGNAIAGVSVSAIAMIGMTVMTAIAGGIVAGSYIARHTTR